MGVSVCVPVRVKVKGKDRRGGGGAVWKVNLHIFPPDQSGSGRTERQRKRRKTFNQTCVDGLRVEVVLLELDVNLQLLAYKLIMPKKGSSDKTSQARTCLSIRHPSLLPPSLQHMHSFTPSPSPWMPLARCHLEKEMSSII